MEPTPPHSRPSPSSAPLPSQPPAPDPGRPSPSSNTPPPGRGSSNALRRRRSEPAYRPDPASASSMHHPPSSLPASHAATHPTSTTAQNPSHPTILTHAAPIPISEPGPNHYPPGSYHGNPNTHPPPPPGDGKFPPPPQQPQQYHYQYQPPPPHPPMPHPAPAAGAALAPNATEKPPLDTARSATQSALRELVALRRQRAMLAQTSGVNGIGPGPGGGKADYQYQLQQATVAGRPGTLQELRAVEDQASAQARAVMQGLTELQWRVGEVVGRVEGQRWRRIMVGGIVASVIPLVKKLFGRPSGDTTDRSEDGEEPANRTEHAFRKSRSLVSRILESTGRPGIGTLAFVVFAVLYIFQNEVSLRAARSVSKRLKRLVARVEDGREELTDADVNMLQGWRWRIVTWSE